MNRRHLTTCSIDCPTTSRGGGTCIKAPTDEKMLHVLRDLVRRTEVAVVNDTLTAGQMKEIIRLLRQKDPPLSYKAIAATVSTPDNPVSVNAVALEAYAIGMKRTRGRKKGVSPSKPARYSPNREQVLRLKEENPDWSNQRIGDAVKPEPISRAAVSRLLNQAISDGRIEKK